jgi:hypothetical protein
MKEVNERYGPLEWRLPEAHAIYWAALGLESAKKHPEKIKPDDLITLRRVIYQSMLLNFQRGRLVSNPFIERFEFGPNLEIIPKVNYAYEQAAVEDEKNRDHILKAHRNFLKDAVYFLYEYNRLKEADYWFKYLGEHYPEKTLIDGKTDSLPGRVTLDEYAMSRVQEDVFEGMDQKRIKAAIEGMLANAYERLAVGEDERAAGYELLAERMRKYYESQVKTRIDALPIAPIPELKLEILTRILDPQQSRLPYAARAVLRTKLKLGPEPAPAPQTTNAPPEKVSIK